MSVDRIWLRKKKGMQQRGRDIGRDNRISIKRDPKYLKKK
ncbi:hypothetical protein NEOC95_001886 [Neochlamydia sp. AcF95]|nr:hypothetical protein [Neochlamydia sp. AcF95]